MGEPRMYRAKGDGIQIQVAEWDGEGLPVLAVHGLTANSRCWDTVASALAPAYRFLAMDLRGRGLSDKPDSGYSIDHHCRDMEALLADLSLDRIVLMGHSLGAFIGLAFAAKAPSKVAGLILVDGGAPLSAARWGKIALALKPSTERLGKEYPSFEAYIAPFKKAGFLQPWSETIEDYFRYESETVDGRIRSRIRPEHIREESTNLLSLDPTHFYNAIKCPVMALRATEGLLSEEDLVMPDEAVAALKKGIPQTSDFQVEGTNHYSIVFKSSEARDQAVLSFLSSLPRR